MKCTFVDVVNLSLERRSQSWQDFRQLKMSTQQAVKIVRLLSEVNKKAEEFDKMRQEIIENESITDKAAAINELLLQEVEIDSGYIELPEEAPFSVIEVLAPFSKQD